MKPAHYARVAPGLVLLCAMAQAQPAESIPAANIRLAFDIHGKQLEEALTEFAQKTQLQVLFPSELVRGQSAREVSGSLTPEAALQTLLAATGLRYEYINANTIAIRPEYDLSVATLRQVRGAAPRFLADVDADSKGGDSGNTPGVEEGRASFASGGMPQVLIKGSRSLNADIERTRDDVLPYVVLDRHTIEASGASNVNDFLRSRLTMNYVPATNSQSFFIGGGSESTIALRGLGDRQTLILIDGRRGGMRGSSGGEFQADLNAIPLSAIERIEVLPATAAGIYGGDATGWRSERGAEKGLLRC
ncbi:MAG: TonB-dependent receptor plug domain-containing protein [Gammaproteobacteria bacterium]